jgi:hypothetical protein
MENILFKDLQEQIDINEILDEAVDAEMEEKLLSGDLMSEIEFDVILG